MGGVGRRRLQGLVADAFTAKIATPFRLSRIYAPMPSRNATKPPPAAVVDRWHGDPFDAIAVSTNTLLQRARVRRAEIWHV
jgi:hypothetical protein